MRTVQRTLVCAGLAALALIACGPAGIALAEAPTVTIASPLAGSVGNSQTPSFSGSSNDELDDVTLNLYSGASVEAGALEYASAGVTNS